MAVFVDAIDSAAISVGPMPHYITISKNFIIDSINQSISIVFFVFCFVVGEVTSIDRIIYANCVACN